MLKSCDSKEFCGMNGRLEGEVKEAVSIVVDLESSSQKSVGTLIRCILWITHSYPPSSQFRKNYFLHSLRI